MAKNRNSGSRHGFKPGLAKNRDNPDKLAKEARRLAELFMKGQHAEVEHSVRTMLTVNPAWGFGWKLLAGTASLLAKEEEALHASTMATRYLSGDPEVFSNHGNILIDLGRFPEAIEAYRTAIRLRPDFAVARNNLGNALKNLGRVPEAIEAYESALKIIPNFIQAYDNLLFAQFYLPGLDNEKILALHRQWDMKLGLNPLAITGSHPNSPDPGRPLKIGYVSPDLGRHPVGIFLSSVLPECDRQKFTLYCYSDRLTEDALSATLQEQCSCWRRIAGVSHQEVAGIIRRDGIDILVDLSGHTAGNRLPVFAMKPAPLQATWIGYPGTTGLKAMDYILLDDAAFRPGEEQHYAEKVIRLPATRFCYTPPAYAPPVAPPPFPTRGEITFGSFNNLAKVTPPVIALWAKILHQVPASRLLLKAAPLGSESVRAEIAAAFAAQGINRDRLLLRGGSSHEELLAEYADVDLALDPFPFTGGLTSCEALWMGVPVITLQGNRPIARQTAGFLKLIGLDGCTATSEAEYLDIAKQWCSRKGELPELRSSLRERMRTSLLCDGATFAANLGEAYRKIWEEWCKRKS